MRAPPPITFYLPGAEDVALMQDLDPDRDWRYFGSGVAIWIGQTYLRLKRAGSPVVLDSRPPASGIVVLHADSLASYFADPGLAHGCLIVCVRADRPRQRHADFEIVQNGASARDPRCRFIPHWPQPGLIPRDPARGSRVANVAYKGGQQESAPMLAQPAWLAFMAQAGLTWTRDEAKWTGPGLRRYDETAWNDYSGTDLIVAIRNNCADPRLNKPASKLVNAWMAGVPAILGPEYAYRELRRSELDYLEAASLEDAMAAVRRLQADPGLYRAMVENGRRRAADFTAQAITGRWQDLLLRDMADYHAGLQGRCLRALPIGLRYRQRALADGLRQLVPARLPPTAGKTF